MKLQIVEGLGPIQDSNGRPRMATYAGAMRYARQNARGGWIPHVLPGPCHEVIEGRPARYWRVSYGRQASQDASYTGRELQGAIPVQGKAPNVRRQNDGAPHEQERLAPPRVAGVAIPRPLGHGTRRGSLVSASRRQ